jgi:hypothetical protein
MQQNVVAFQIPTQIIRLVQSEKRAGNLRSIVAAGRIPA